MVLVDNASEITQRVYRSLRRIRVVEEKIVEVYPMDKVLSPTHLSIGQEAISVGVCDALAAGDIAFGTYRSHALYLAKGGELKAMIAELYGKATGCAKGKAGSMHLIDAAAGAMGASAIVGTTIPQAVGYALALQMRREKRVVVCFFGEGAAEEGAFSESINFARLRKLPILFVCENNFFAIHSPTSARQSAPDISTLARAYGLTPHTLREMDVLQIRQTAIDCVEALRRGEGPQFMECFCYRWMEHVGPGEDFGVGYRSKSEAQPWIDRDAVKVIGDQLPAADRQRIDATIHAEVADAFEFAERSPFPEADALYAGLYADAEAVNAGQESKSCER